MSYSHAPTPAFRPLMVFIDGGYLRGLMEVHNYRITDVDIQGLLRTLSSRFSPPRISCELIRAYYYDANVVPEQDPDEYRKRDAEFELIRECEFFQLRMGRLIKASKGGYRQKGVDVLLAIDMITKAYEKQYDIALLVAGDDDFVQVVNVVKDQGRRVLGAYELQSASKRLIQAFDVRLPFEFSDIPRKQVVRAGA